MALSPKVGPAAPPTAVADSSVSGVVTYDAGWTTNSITWSNRNDQRLAVVSFIPDHTNYVQILQRSAAPADGSLRPLLRFDQFYPPTKVLYAPVVAGAGGDGTTDIIATSSDFLRLYQIEDTMEGDGTASGGGAGASSSSAGMASSDTMGSHPDQSASADTAATAAGRSVVKHKLLHTLKPPPSRSTAGSTTSTTTASLQALADVSTAPLTSFDWNSENVNMLAVCSADTTVTVWDVEKPQIIIQIIAHDKEVYDVAFARGVHVFASAGADGSVRVFDLRRTESCTIVYESPDAKPMMRCAWNKGNPTYLACISDSSTSVPIIDLRNPSAPVGELRQHEAPINALCWAPSSTMLCSAGEDKRAIVWDLADFGKTSEALGGGGMTPAAPPMYHASSEINGCAWSTMQEDWVAITCGSLVQVLNV